MNFTVKLIEASFTEQDVQWGVEIKRERRRENCRDNGEKKRGGDVSTSSVGICGRDGMGDAHLSARGKVVRSLLRVPKRTFYQGERWCIIDIDDILNWTCQWMKKWQWFEYQLIIFEKKFFRWQFDSLK